VILLYGRTDDGPFRRTVEAAQAAGVEHLVIDQRHLTTHELALVLGAGGPAGWVVVGGQLVDLSSVRGVYARPLELPPSPDPVDELRCRTFNTAFLEWLDVAPCSVVSRPQAMESNSSKPFQAQLIARAGFAVPATVVTNDPDDILEFRRRHGRVIFKSTSGVRSIVREMDPASESRLDRLRSLPTMFQAYVAGVDVRVHVVGRRTFPTEVRSRATDYRYAANDGMSVDLEAIELPDDIEARCVSLARALDLPLCGIDLRRCPDGRWVCFEVNPMPAFSYYEDATGQEISAAVVDLLAAGAEVHSNAGR